MTPFRVNCGEDLGHDRLRFSVLWVYTKFARYNPGGFTIVAKYKANKIFETMKICAMAMT